MIPSIGGTGYLVTEQGCSRNIAGTKAVLESGVGIYSRLTIVGVAVEI